MNGLTAFLTVTAVFAVSLPAAYWQIRRAQRAESERDRLIRQAHERAVQAREADPNAVDHPVPTVPLPAELEDHLICFLIHHPDVADGFARLHRAIEDQPKGDQQ